MYSPFKIDIPRRGSGESKYSTLRSLKSSLGWKERASAFKLDTSSGFKLDKSSGFKLDKPSGFKLFGRKEKAENAKIQSRPAQQVEEDYR
jgi:hypothetical protein